MPERPLIRNLSIEMVEIPRMEFTSVWVDDEHVLIELWAKDDGQRELLGRVAKNRKEGEQLLVELDGRALLRRIRTISLRPGFQERDKLVLTIILGPVLSEPQCNETRLIQSRFLLRRAPFRSRFPLFLPA
ncbi:MAG: hypothetical protein LYZ69_09495 [Nitrososphaerales archaeon]|nr:hypothetical protein [Nitrososphaerales archaeon]